MERRVALATALAVAGTLAVGTVTYAAIGGVSILGVGGSDAPAAVDASTASPEPVTEVVVIASPTTTVLAELVGIPESVPAVSAPVFALVPSPATPAPRSPTATAAPTTVASTTPPAPVAAAPDAAPAVAAADKPVQVQPATNNATPVAAPASATTVATTAAAATTTVSRSPTTTAPTTARPAGVPQRLATGHTHPTQTSRLRRRPAGR